MNKFQRHFTEEAFLFSTFVEFNKCWRSGKKSRLVIESVKGGLAFVNFSAFLGDPKTMHVVPPEKEKPGRTRKKSKKRTERDNERAARFHARKQQERDAAVSEASKGACPPPATSTPVSEFIFSEPTQENVSSNSNFADLNIDGNVTISSEASTPAETKDVCDKDCAGLIAWDCALEKVECCCQLERRYDETLAKVKENEERMKLLKEETMKLREEGRKICEAAGVTVNVVNGVKSSKSKSKANNSRRRKKDKEKTSE